MTLRLKIVWLRYTVEIIFRLKRWKAILGLRCWRHLSPFKHYTAFSIQLERFRRCTLSIVSAALASRRFPLRSTRASRRKSPRNARAFVNLNQKEVLLYDTSFEDCVATLHSRDHLPPETVESNLGIQTLYRALNDMRD